MTEMEMPFKRKSNLVNLNLDPVFKEAAPIIKTAWTMYGAEAVVTSGKDGKHSANSAHYRGQAIDLRIWNLAGVDLVLFCQRLVVALVHNLGPYWYVVLESDHIHLEFSRERPNIKGYQAGRHFYAQKGVS
jgi:hypothetical protein